MYTNAILKVIDHTGRRVVEGVYQYFINVSFNNDEHVPSVKAAIESAGVSADNLVRKETGALSKAHLKAYARELFVEYWINLAESSDDSEGVEVEKDRAIEGFESIFSR